MKKIIILLPFLIGCSFQIKDTEKEENRLSRRPILEDQIYGELNFDEGFAPYEYDKFFIEDDISDRQRNPRELNLFKQEEVDTNKDIFTQDSFYRGDELNYERVEEIPLLKLNYNDVEDIKFE